MAKTASSDDEFGAWSLPASCVKIRVLLRCANRPDLHKERGMDMAIDYTFHVADLPNGKVSISLQAPRSIYTTLTRLRLTGPANPVLPLDRELTQFEFNTLMDHLGDAGYTVGIN